MAVFANIRESLPLLFVLVLVLQNVKSKSTKVPTGTVDCYIDPRTGAKITLKNGVTQPKALPLGELLKLKEANGVAQIPEGDKIGVKPSKIPSTTPSGKPIIIQDLTDFRKGPDSATRIGISVPVRGQSPKVLRSRQIGFEGQVLSRILSEYDAHTRPPVRGCPLKSYLIPFIVCFTDSADHSAIVVIASIFINRILWHDHHAVVDLYLRQQWEDGRLVYEVDNRDGVEEVVVPHGKRIWIPDTYFTNGDDVRHEKRHRTVIEPNGFVRSSEMRTVTVPVEYGSKFPFDNTRIFKLRLSSYNYPIEDVVYLWANSPPTVVPVEVSQELLSGPYEFKEAVAEDCVGNYTIGVYSCIDVLVTFTGSSSEAFWRIFIPSLFLLFSSWLHFWVHGSWSVPRTISAAVPFFIFASILIFYPQPYLSTFGVSGLQVWLLFCLLLTFASLVEYFIVICCGIRRTIRYKNGKILKDDESPLTVTRETVEVAYDTKCANFKQNHGIDLVSRVLFPLIFFIFFVVFLILYLI